MPIYYTNHALGRHWKYYQSCSILVVQHFLRQHSLQGQNIQSISPLVAKCGGTVLVKVRHLTQRRTYTRPKQWRVRNGYTFLRLTAKNGKKPIYNRGGVSKPTNTSIWEVLLYKEEVYSIHMGSSHDSSPMHCWYKIHAQNMLHFLVWYKTAWLINLYINLYFCQRTLPYGTKAQVCCSGRLKSQMSLLTETWPTFFEDFICFITWRWQDKAPSWAHVAEILVNFANIKNDLPSPYQNEMGFQ